MLPTPNGINIDSPNDLMDKEFTNMPVHAEGTKIVETSTGKVVGKSANPEKAKAAARVRNAIHFSNWRPTKGPKKLVKEGGDYRK
jgi:hypothetical protein